MSDPFTEGIKLGLRILGWGALIALLMGVVGCLVFRS